MPVLIRCAAATRSTPHATPVVRPSRCARPSPRRRSGIRRPAPAGRRPSASVTACRPSRSPWTARPPLSSCGARAARRPGRSRHRRGRWRRSTSRPVGRAGWSPPWTTPGVIWRCPRARPSTNRRRGPCGGRRTRTGPTRTGSGPGLRTATGCASCLRSPRPSHPTRWTAPRSNGSWRENCPWYPRTRTGRSRCTRRAAGSPIRTDCSATRDWYPRSSSVSPSPAPERWPGSGPSWRRTIVDPPNCTSARRPPSGCGGTARGWTRAVATSPPPGWTWAGPATCSNSSCRAPRTGRC